MRFFLIFLANFTEDEFLVLSEDPYPSYAQAPQLQAQPGSEATDLALPWGDFDTLVVLYRDEQEDEAITFVQKLSTEAAKHSEGTFVRAHRFTPSGTWTVWDESLSSYRSAIQKGVLH